MDGQNFLKVVCGELVGVIRIIGPFNTHHSTKLLDFVSPVCNKTQRMNLITSCNDLQNQITGEMYYLLFPRFVIGFHVNLLDKQTSAQVP